MTINFKSDLLEKYILPKNMCLVLIYCQLPDDTLTYTAFVHLSKNS